MFIAISTYVLPEVGNFPCTLKSLSSRTFAGDRALQANPKLYLPQLPILHLLVVNLKCKLPFDI